MSLPTIKISASSIDLIIETLVCVLGDQRAGTLLWGGSGCIGPPLIFWRENGFLKEKEEKERGKKGKMILKFRKPERLRGQDLNI